MKSIYIFLVLLLCLTACSKQLDTDTNIINLTNNSLKFGTRNQTSNCTFDNWPYPDYDCSPGAIFPNATKEVICVTGYTKTVRNVSEKLKKQVYEEYGIYERKPYEYEIDHIISLELGGSNDIANLYPEKYNDTLGARVKDKIENKLHKMVCNNEISLEQAQYDILYNWTKYLD